MASAPHFTMVREAPSPPCVRQGETAPEFRSTTARLFCGNGPRGPLASRMPRITGSLTIRTLNPRRACLSSVPAARLTPRRAPVHSGPGARRLIVSPSRTDRVTRGKFPAQRGQNSPPLRTKPRGPWPKVAPLCDSSGAKKPRQSPSETFASQVGRRPTFDQNQGRDRRLDRTSATVALRAAAGCYRGRLRRLGTDLYGAGGRRHNTPRLWAPPMSPQCWLRAARRVRLRADSISRPGHG